MGGIVLGTVSKTDIPLMDTCILIRKETCKQDRRQRVMSAGLRVEVGDVLFVREGVTRGSGKALIRRC